MITRANHSKEFAGFVSIHINVFVEKARRSNIKTESASKIYTLITSWNTFFFFFFFFFFCRGGVSIIHFTVIPVESVVGALQTGKIQTKEQKQQQRRRCTKDNKLSCPHRSLPQRRLPLSSSRRMVMGAWTAQKTSPYKFAGGCWAPVNRVFPGWLQLCHYPAAGGWWWAHGQLKKLLHINLLAAAEHR